MKRIRKFIVLLFSVSLLFLCGCSQSNEDEVRKVKRFEALKGLPLDTVLTRAYKFYEQFQATGDTLLRDSMNDYRDHFFARWELSSDSLCGTIAPDDSLAAELREINAAVMRYLVQQENRRAESIYYAQLLQVNYKDASSSGRMEKKKSACMKGTPMGQKVIALSEQYETILNKFMNANAQGGLREGFDVKKAFFLPLIEVQQKHRGNGYHFESFPAVVDITFNADHDKAEVAVRRSFYSGSYYELSKNDGKWEVVRQTSRWMN